MERIWSARGSRGLASQERKACSFSWSKTRHKTRPAQDQERRQVLPDQQWLLESVLGWFKMGVTGLTHRE